MKKVYLIATLVAIIAGIATYFFATQIEQNTKIKDAPTLSVVVAIVPIPENTVITAEMVALKQYTAVSVTPNSASKLEDVLGKLSRYPVVVGEQLILEKLSTLGQEDEKAALSYQLKEGEYAYTMAVDNVQGVAGFISKGDYVDILYTSKPDGATKFNTVILMSNVHVLRVANFTANYAAEASGAPPITAYAEITFNLSKAQIIQLSEKMSESGNISLALKSITSGEKDAGVTKPAAETQTTVATTKAG